VRTACRWTLSVRADGTLAPPVPPVSLGTPGLNDPSQSYSLSYGMNDLGDVCGLSDERPFVAPAGETAQPLPVPRGTVSGRAHAINNLGAIVGWLEIVPKNYVGFFPYAYLWKDGAMVNLEKQIGDDSGWDRLWKAYVINDRGVIAGLGRYDVEHRGFLLIPNAP
jgi:probable HAF family extracellular repeat protein